MRWWTKLKILKAILYVLMAFVLVNCLLIEIFPTLYPEWLIDGLGIVGLFIIALGVVWWGVYLIKKLKNKKK